MAKKGMLGAILLIIGAILLIAALFTSWYTWSLQESGAGGSITGDTDFHAGTSYTTSFSCSGEASSVCPSGATCPYSGSSSTGCTAAGENKTGQLYAVTEFIVIGGLVLGFLAGILALMGGTKPGMRKGAVALGAIALILALVGPVVLLAAQPGAVKSDSTPSGGSAPSGSGPYSSYFGSCSGSNCGFGGSGATSVSGTWGPSVGWYLSIVAFVLFLLGVIMVMRGGRESSAMPASAPAPAAPMDSSMGAPPPASPPS
jgi:hypothetical protein